MGRIILPFSTFYYICNEMVLAIPPLRDLVQHVVYLIAELVVNLKGCSSHQAYRILKENSSEIGN